jgi:hypothetical protein
VDTYLTAYFSPGDSMFEESIGGSTDSESPQAMEAILAQRYAIFYFSNVPGFLNPMPERNEWESCLPKFKGEYWEVPAEFLLDFHEYMRQLGIIHEDVLMKMFRYSLEGKAREWCRSLPQSNISSLKEFHVVFNSYCKRKYAVDFLYDECCEEFQLLHHFSNHKIQDDSSSHMHEETIIQSEGFIEHVVSTFGIDETMLLSSDSHDNLVVLNLVKEFSSQDNDQQFQEDFVAPNHYEAIFT